MRVLVTGGAGYIGSHTVRELIASGHEPVVLDNLCEGHRAAVRDVELIECDLRDAAATERALRGAGCEAVIHFAALCYVGDSVRQPADYFRNNLLGGFNLLEAMRAASVRRIVFSSSCTVYGVPQRVPIPETEPVKAISPYGLSKQAFEAMLQAYATAYGFSGICLRYFNAAGAHPDGVLGEDHEPETHLIPRAIFAAAGRIPKLDVFGTDYPSPDGTCVRDYIHIVDLAQAHLISLGRLGREGSEGSWDAFNLGTGRGYSVREVVREVTRVTGRPVPCADGPRRPGDPPMLVAEADRARSVLGWKPRYSELGTIVETAWNWFRDHPQGYGDRGPLRESS